MSASPLTTTADIDSTDYVRGINRIREIMPDSPRLEAVELYVGALLEQIDALRSALTASGEALREAEEFVDRHSEPWYANGQQLLAKIRAAMEKANG